MSLLLPVYLGVACLGVEVGWRPLPDGGTEYVIRVSPEELADLELGDIIAASDVPPGLPPIKSYRIEVGRGPVERLVPSTIHGTSERAESSGNPSAADNQQSAPSGPAPPVTTVPSVFTEPAGPQPTETSPTAPPQQSGRGQGSVKPRENDPDSQAEAASRFQQTGDGPPPTKTGEASVESPGKNSESLINTLALSGMTASFAAVLYIGWVAWEYRRKYLELLRAGQNILRFDTLDDGPPTADGPAVFAEEAHGEGAGCRAPPRSEESSAGDRYPLPAQSPPETGLGP